MEKNKTKKAAVCPVAKKCGGCEFQGMSYAEQLRHKEKRVRILLDSFGKVHPIIGMKDPYHYRNKVHAVFDRDRRGNPFHFFIIFPIQTQQNLLRCPAFLETYHIPFCI